MLTKLDIHKNVHKNIDIWKIPNNQSYIYRILEDKCVFPSILFLYLKHFNYKILC